MRLAQMGEFQTTESCIQVFRGDRWCRRHHGYIFFGDSWGIRVVLTMLEGEDIMDNDDKGVFNQNR